MKKVYMNVRGKLLILPLLLLFNSLSAQFCMTPTQTVGLFPSATTQTTSAYTTGAICFTFNATAGCTYAMATCNLSVEDTYLRLYQGIGGTLLGSYDDNCGAQSAFVWVCPTTGLYSVLMNEYSCGSLLSSTALSYSTSCLPCSGTPASGTAAISSTVGCPNVSLNLSATGMAGVALGYNYQWYRGASATGPWTVISGANAPTTTTNVPTTSYFQMVTTCSVSALTASTSIVSYSNTGSTITVSNGSVCPGGSFVIAPTGASTYTYYGASGSLGSGASITVNPIVNATYSVAGTGTNGCITTSISPNAGISVVSLLQSPTLTAISTPTAFCNGGSAALTVSGASTYTWSSPASNSNAISVAPVVTTVYTVSGTGTTVCNGITTVTVVVNQIPTVTINSGTLCTGYNFTLTPSGASTYTMANASGTVASPVSPSATANYTVLGTSAAGCISNPLAAPISTVFVVPSPTITAISGSVCIGLSFSITPSGSNGSYSVNGTALGGNSIGAFNPNTTTSYTVTGTNTNGCVSFTPAIATISTVVNPTVSVLSSTSAVCLSQATASLSASGANTYTWSNAATGASLAASPSVTTVYMVTGTSTLLCSSSATVQVNVLPLPIVTAQSSQNFICVGGNSTLTASGANSYSWSNNNATSLTVVNPIVNTNYVVTGTDLNGCKNTATVAISVNTIVLTVAPLSTTVCLGSSTTFSASGAVSYTWNGVHFFGIYPVTPSVAAVYTVVSIDANSCPASKTVSVGIYQLPSVNISLTSTTICLGESATLTASGANTYSWNNTSTNASIVVSPTINLIFNYSVVGTDANNCTASASKTMGVSQCVGLDKTFEKSAEMVVYPNPSAGVFNIDLNGTSVKNIQVIDLTGRMIINQSVNADKLNVDLSNYARGVYYLNIVGASNTKTIKLIKE